MEALGYGGEACQQTRSVSCLQTGRGPVLRWAGNRNQWGVVSITCFLCGFCIVKCRNLLCQWSQELVCVRMFCFWFFFFMFPLVILDGTQPTEATLQTHLSCAATKGHCLGCNRFARPCGWTCLDHELALQCTCWRRTGGGGAGTVPSLSFAPKRRLGHQSACFIEQLNMHKDVF